MTQNCDLFSIILQVDGTASLLVFACDDLYCCFQLESWRVWLSPGMPHSLPHGLSFPSQLGWLLQIAVLEQHSNRMKMEVVKPLEFQALKLACHFYHILLNKASHKASPDSGGREIDSTSWMEGASKNLWQHLSTTHYLLVRNLQMPQLVLAPVTWVTGRQNNDSPKVSTS